MDRKLNSPTARGILGSGIAVVPLWLAFFTVPSGAVQAPPPEPPNSTLVSPEVLSDRSVVFRILAPKATGVTLRGDWMEGQESLKLEKNDQGLWSIKVGPLTPDLYTYSFDVDGIRTIDPKNVLVKQGTRDLANMFSVPGEEAVFEENQMVPHGDIRIVWYRSSALGIMRSMRIYTPPGYDSGTTRYPVLYLLHGGGDEDSAWSTVGRAGFILDNLLAQRKAKPMIIVMPNGSMPNSANPGRGAVTSTAQEQFASELLGSIIPHVEKNYRVIAGRDNRAIAGLSMGGGQTLRVALSDVDRFRYIAVWSAGVSQQGTADFEMRNAAFLNNPDKTNKKVSLFWIGVGVKDSLANASAKNLAELLKKHGIKYEFHESTGAHTWINWRHYLNEYAQLLFR